MKNKALTSIVLLAALLACASMSRAALFNALGYEWGTLIEKVKKTIPSDKEYVQFTPGDKPKYKNRILSYITAIDGKLADKIIILQIKSKPDVEYLFVNSKLYSIVEDWGKIDQKTEKELQARLAKQFGGPTVQQDKNFYIYSFNNDKTKVLCYLLKRPEGASTCKVYYYTKQLFRMLISE